jgi:hypothetical protein
MKIGFVFLYSFLHIYCFSQDAKDSWVLKKNEQGVSVYSRKTSESDIKELKSVIYLKTSLKSIVALIDDWESYPQWVYQCGVSSTLKKISDTEGMHYQTVLAPWPAEDRDFVVNIKLTQDEKTGVVTIRSTCDPDYIPQVDDHVRVTKLSSFWTLAPMKDGTIQVCNQILVDPGGNIPAWLVNMAAVEGPYQTMVHLKEMVLKKKYQDAKITFIKDPLLRRLPE